MPAGPYGRETQRRDETDDQVCDTKRHTQNPPPKCPDGVTERATTRGVDKLELGQEQLSTPLDEAPTGRKSLPDVALRTTPYQRRGFP